MNYEKTIAKDEESDYNYVKDGATDDIRFTPKNDIIFKMLFGKQGNEGLLKDFLEALLEIKIAHLELNKSTILFPENFNGKSSILDVRATLDDGTKVNIEMQNRPHIGIEARAVFYLDKLYLQSVSKGAHYEDIPKAIVIFILNFNHFKNIESYHSSWHWACDNDPNVKLQNQELHLIELPKFRSQAPDLNKKLTQWLVFLDYQNRELINMATEKNEKVKEANEELDKILADERAQYLEEIELLAEMDRASELNYYKKEGISEGKIEVAKNLLKLGLSVEDISKATGLSIEEINKL